ncbi:hypothetical protein [Actinophytocola glycyrrhizae]|uniref:Excreted virulence factor EspC (Type VII ESX diderm) n=1 Tax=Actinophytocola glycyrrhizae TaxID=2044873 RepID=A0ABV9SCZ9_9PSEU
MAPTKDQYEVALAALRDDATTWTGCADDLAAAKSTADGLDLEALHFSYLADKCGVTQLYADFQSKFVRLLGEGETTCHAVSDALLAAAQTYQQEEEAGVHNLNNVW